MMIDCKSPLICVQEKLMIFTDIDFPIFPTWLSILKDMNPRIP